jgi:hypothetical protein
MSSVSKLQELAHLQVKICTCAERIKYLKHKIHLLSNNKCTTVIKFTITNSDQVEINEGRKKVDQLEAVPAIFEPRAPETQMPTAQFQFTDTIDESIAMRMINILYQDEVACHNKLVAEMEKLVLENNFKSIDPSIAQA